MRSRRNLSMSSDYILGLQIMCRFFIALGFSYIGLEAAGSRNLVLYYRTKISLIVVFSLSGLFFTYIAADIAYTIGHPRALLIAIFVRRMCMFVSGDSFLSLIGKGITGTVLYGMIMLAIHIKNPVLTLPRLKSWDSCFNHHCGLPENPWPAFVLHGVRRRFGLLPGARVPHGAQIQKALCRRGEHRQSLLFYVHSRVYIAVMMCTAYRTCPFPDGQVLGFRIPVSADVTDLA